jgi:hypothetical protein
LGQRNEPAPPGQADKLAKLTEAIGKHYEDLVATYGGDPYLGDPAASDPTDKDPAKNGGGNGGT